MNLGPHATFIVAAYAAAAIILALLIGWIIAEHRALKRKLADFEARGITRRSDQRIAPLVREGRGESAA